MTGRYRVVGAAIRTRGAVIESDHVQKGDHSEFHVWGRFRVLWVAVVVHAAFGEEAHYGVVAGGERGGERDVACLARFGVADVVHLVAGRDHFELVTIDVFEGRLGLRQRHACWGLEERDLVRLSRLVDEVEPEVAFGGGLVEAEGVVECGDLHDVGPGWWWRAAFELESVEQPLAVLFQSLERDEVDGPREGAGADRDLDVDRRRFRGDDRFAVVQYRRRVGAEVVALAGHDVAARADVVLR